jgi:hypothetical protein
MTGQATDKTEAEAVKSSPLRIGLIILAVPALAALFIAGVVLLIAVGSVMVYFLAIVAMIFHGGHHGPF